MYLPGPRLLLLLVCLAFSCSISLGQPEGLFSEVSEQKFLDSTIQGSSEITPQPLSKLASSPGTESPQVYIRIPVLYAQSWWVYLIFGLVFLMMLIGLRRYEMERKSLKYQAEIERARADEKNRHAEKIEAQARNLERMVAELKEKNEEITLAQQRLMVQDKLATLGQLVAGIAHEIKNPLNFVTNFSEINLDLLTELKEELKKQAEHIDAPALVLIYEILEDLHQNTGDTLSNGKRANSIILNMMDLTRGSGDQSKMVNINQLVEENIKLAYHGYRAMDHTFNLAIEKHLDSSLPMIPAFQSDLGRVFLNILSNSCYAVHQQKKKKGEPYSPILSVWTQAVNGHVRIKIRDNGPGIPPSILDKIFNPFFTTKPAGEGNTGLGLSISREIIEEKHGGKLEVESQPQKFTEFTISLPTKQKQTVS